MKPKVPRDCLLSLSHHIKRILTKSDGSLGQTTGFEGSSGLKPRHTEEGAAQQPCKSLFGCKHPKNPDFNRVVLQAAAVEDLTLVCLCLHDSLLLFLLQLCLRLHHLGPVGAVPMVKLLS
ncbi:hypothetical protein Ae201684P_021645 [Aphanomyces euteiches]|uniref:Uncharacterized protein n=1 Tax=Aphanomyces euteiches TaxID=100861 RepID=A0A6G0X7T8_9STRA|nr:hypothetical protein Ae201684_007624 [Aphanomyces euteiches]KAH9067488.1 hypothetical protein Ae201684P_021645 [Aphanomyces euteiches]